jgi:hypothetical protein
MGGGKIDEPLDLLLVGGKKELEGAKTVDQQCLFGVLRTFYLIEGCQVDDGSNPLASRLEGGGGKDVEYDALGGWSRIGTGREGELATQSEGQPFAAGKMTGDPPTQITVGSCNEDGVKFH